MTSVAWTDSSVEIAGTKMHLSRAGSGPIVLVLHHDIGTLDRLPFYDALAQRFDVLVPHHPGWGKSERAAWLRHPRDIAATHQWLLATLGARDVSLVGLGFGGWIAAEMASLAPTAFRKLVLVGAMGIKPPEGDIADQASCHTSTIRRRDSTIPRSSHVCTGTRPPISWRHGTSRARCASVRLGSLTCTVRRCRICWAG